MKLWVFGINSSYKYFGGFEHLNSTLLSPFKNFVRTKFNSVQQEIPKQNFTKRFNSIDFMVLFFYFHQILIPYVSETATNRSM